MILQRLVGVAKPYRKYFRFRGKKFFSIFSRLYGLYGFGPSTGSTSGMALRPQRVALESPNGYFDTNLDHFHQKLRPLEVPPFFA